MKITHSEISREHLIETLHENIKLVSVKFGMAGLTNLEIWAVYADYLFAVSKLVYGKDTDLKIVIHGQEYSFAEIAAQMEGLQ